ncbi:hypothetical protein F53441_7472 [Fusarium austroafricanum]|uniref:SRR1-like domain-containing protein n=1 Tax=Fusarium austroafricanum TaxID=2364996 RepID=A0A8H4KHF0_9HYPO|nr:hypothetical protein F53441_7472 [Fusarium austroafricanum]
MSSDSEWTPVVRKGRKNKNNNAKSNSDSNSPAKSPFVKPLKKNLRDPKELHDDYKRYREQWELEEYCSRVREIVATKAAHLKGINKAINFGIGSFDPRFGAGVGLRSSFIQLAAFEDMVEELEKITGEKIKTYLQEPAFNAADKKFLEDLGHTVIEDPQGTEMVDPDTFFYGIHLYKPVYNDALAKHLPALYVGTGYEAWSGLVGFILEGDMANEDSIFTSEGVENVKKMHDVYDHCEFPRERHDRPFSTTSIYWRPRDDGEENLDERHEKGKGIVIDEVEIDKVDEEELAKKLEATTIN